jgi:PAS domain-containing protein
VAGYLALTLANQVAAQRLKESGENGGSGFREIAGTSAIGIVRWECGGRFSDPNDAFLRMIGRTSEELRLVRDCSELTPPEYTIYPARQNNNSGSTVFASRLRRSCFVQTAVEFLS